MAGFLELDDGAENSDGICQMPKWQVAGLYVHHRFHDREENFVLLKVLIRSRGALPSKLSVRGGEEGNE